MPHCLNCNKDKLIAEMKSANNCIDCRKDYNKAYYLKNKTALLERGKILNAIYYKNNRDKLLEQHKKYNSDNYDSIYEQKKTYRKDNVRYNLYQNEYIKLRRKRDPLFKLRKNISSQIFIYLKRQGGNKSNFSIMKYLPYSIQELKEHLEKQFEPWMTWKNSGNYRLDQWDENDPTTWTWQLDHIVPQSKLPYSSMEDNNFKKCWALENLRPYSAKQNILDSSRNNE